MKKLIVTALAIGLAAALQPAALAQFGSGIVYDPTQSVHAVTQIEHEERSISNQFQQIEQGQQIFTNTVKIATTASTSLQRRQAAIPTRAPDDSRAVHALSTVSVSHDRPDGCCNKSRTRTAIRWGGSTPRTPGTGRQPPTSRSACPSTTSDHSGYTSASVAGQLQIAAQGATVDIGDSVMTNNLQMLGTMRANQAARQTDITTLEAATQSQDATQQTIMATLQRINQALLLQLRTQQDANQMNANLALQQIVAQKQQQDAMKSAFRDSSGYESYYNANVATTSGGAANLLTQAY